MPRLFSAILWSGSASPIPAGLEWVILGAVILIGLMSFAAARSARQRVPTDDESWKAGVFYVNRADPALFVPKRFGIGYTINFGNRWAWVVVVVLAALIIAPFIFSAITLATIRHHLTSH